MSETPTETPPAVAPLEPAQRRLATVAGAVGTALAGLGGFESYGAVKQVAVAHDFAHPSLFPIGVDAGVVAFFLIELLLAWLKIPFPPLRWCAWALVGATIWWNAAASAGNLLGMAMHATAPLLVVVWVEAIGHAVRVRTQMAKGRHVEGPPFARWLLAPAATARLWRHQRLWNVASYTEALALERRRLLAIAKLRARHGRRWRRRATPMERLALRLDLQDERPAETTPPWPPSGDETPPARTPRRPRATSRKPSRKPSRPASAAKRRDEMQAWVLAERDAGRNPTGADLDREFGTNNYGRRVLAGMAGMAAGNGHAPVTAEAIEEGAS
jgi:uncharacterized protein DUF2637